MPASFRTSDSDLFPAPGRGSALAPGVVSSAALNSPSLSSARSGLLSRNWRRRMVSFDMRPSARRASL